MWVRNISVSFLFIFFVFWLAIPASADSKEVDPERLNKVHELIKLVTAEKTLAGVRETIQKSLPTRENKPGKIPEKYFDALDEALSATFDTKEMVDELADLLAINLPQSTLASATKFFKSELGIKAATLEGEAQSAEFSSSIRARLAEIEAKFEAAPERNAIIDQMMLDMSVVDQGMALANNILFSMFSGMVASDQIPQKLSAQEIHAIASSQMEKLRPQVEREIKASFFVTYDSLTDDELKEYASFLNSKNGKLYFDHVISGLSDVVGNQSKKFGAILVKAVGKEKL